MEENDLPREKDQEEKLFPFLLKVIDRRCLSLDFQSIQQIHAYQTFLQLQSPKCSFILACAECFGVLGIEKIAPSISLKILTS